MASGLEAARSHTDNERHAQEANCRGQGPGLEGTVLSNHVDSGDLPAQRQLHRFSQREFNTGLQTQHGLHAATWLEGPRSPPCLLLPLGLGFHGKGGRRV